MNLDLFNYHLPSDLIAQSPKKNRSSSKLMLINRKTNQISHHYFYDLPHLLPKNSMLVFNNSKVFPARLIGKKPTGGIVEILILSQISEKKYLAMCRPGQKIGTKIFFDSDNFTQVEEISPYRFVLSFHTKYDNMYNFFDKFGITPTPPYIKTFLSESDLRESYQTVYAKSLGSVAAPTAGLHFDENLLKTLQKSGISFENITLHVSAGTFEPVREEQIYSKHLHHEHIIIAKETAQSINSHRQSHHPIVAVGTTSMRALEAMSNDNKVLQSGSRETDIFIFPPYKFNLCDALITNFHLPKSSLLMLVSAFVSLPNTSTPFSTFDESLLGMAYNVAIANNYQFFSFGDAMLIV